MINGSPSYGGARELMKEDWRDEPVLSVYLNVDQSLSRNLNGGYRTPLRNMLRDAGEQLPPGVTAKWFQRAAKEVTACVEQSAAGRTLVVFVAPDRGYRWSRTLAITCSDAIHIGPRPMIGPLVYAQDEYEPCLVILAGRDRTRMFMLELGAAEGPVVTMADSDIERPAAAGSDQMYSQSRFHSRAEEHVREHFRRVIEQAGKLVAEEHCNKMVLAGPTESVSDFEKLLPESLRKILIAKATLDSDAPEKDVIEQIRAVVTAREREDEGRLVEELVTRSAKNSRAVLGMAECAAAVSEGRVQQLIISENNLDAPQEDIDLARVSFPEQIQPWVSTARDVVEFMIEQTLLTGGEVEAIRGQPAAELNERAHGAGAFLRYHIGTS